MNKKKWLFLLGLLGSAGLVLVAVHPWRSDSSATGATLIEKENRLKLRQKLDEIYGYNL